MGTKNEHVFTLMKCVQIFITAPTRDEAERIGRHILDQKLVACYQLISSVQSVYWWKGQQETADECMILAKSTDSLVPSIVQAVTALHSYEVPEIIAVPIVGGNPDYLSWIESSVSR